MKKLEPARVQQIAWKMTKTMNPNSKSLQLYTVWVNIVKTHFGYCKVCQGQKVSPDLHAQMGQSSTSYKIVAHLGCFSLHALFTR